MSARSLGEQELVFHHTLVTLLGDVLALDADGAPDGPLELLFDVFAEARAGVLRGEGDPFERDADEAFALLAQLLVGSTAELAVLDALNVRLLEVDTSAREYHLPGTYEPNPRFVSDDAFVWGLTAFDQLHAQWLAFVVERFPRSSVALETTRAKLIDAGRAPLEVGDGIGARLRVTPRSRAHLYGLSRPVGCRQGAEIVDVFGVRTVASTKRTDTSV